MALTYIVPTSQKIAALEQYQRNANQFGYGNKIRTDHMVQLDGAAKWYRVYAICHGNCFSLYVIRQGEQLFISNL